MSLITRKLQKIFSDAVVATGNIAKFGSLAASSPQYSKDPDVIQALAAFDNGWASALINAPGGVASPALQDMNALFFLITRQLAYVYQHGLPEWDTGETYFIGSWCQVAGVGYISKTDNNTANDPTTDTNNWKTVASTLLTAGSQLKAWVTFDGTTGAIASSFNVASITKTASGSYVVNFATAMADANYGFSGSAGTKPGGSFINGNDNLIVGGVSGRTSIRTTTQCSVFCFDRPNFATEDASAISVQFFGN